MNTPRFQEFRDQLRSDGLLGDPGMAFEALTGGVSSEIYKIGEGSDAIVVKRALKELKVAEFWEADLSRNAFEVRYLKFVDSIAPGAVPKVLFEGDGYFAMEYLGGSYMNWKTALLKGRFESEVAARVGSIIGSVHSSSYGDKDVSDRFQSLENFIQLRISPYIDFLRSRYPKLMGPLKEISTSLAGSSECLVHGDLSPKNILYASDRAILLDCEVAWYGDPAFDLAFLLNHLCLKALYHTPDYVDSRRLIDSFMKEYFQEREMPEGERIELLGRTARLLGVLMLARVDGKSPVEYLAESKALLVRGFAVPAISESRSDLDSLLDDWFFKVRTLCKE